jgi:hypothetical protein
MTPVLSSVRRAAAFGAAAILCVALLAPSGVHAQSYTWKSVAIGGGGFVPGIVFNPTQANLLYARTDMGTAYRWDATNSKWIPLLDWLSPDDWNLTGVESIATDPIDPNRLYLAVGTYTNEWATTNGAILRSTDKGATFTRTNLPFKLGGNMPGRSMGERLAIDPNNDQILYFGARSGNGLWKSTDFGATWAKVTSFTDVGTYVQDPSNSYTADNVGVVWVTFDPKSGTLGSATKTIYVGVADKTTPLWRSTDGGATWAPVPGQPTGFLPHHGVLASTGILFVTYNNNAGPYDGTSGDVWKLATATGTWTKISPVPSTDTSNDYFGYGGLAVDAQHPNTIMVSALNSWWPDTIFWRSLDAGATWTKIWDWTSYPSRSLRYTLDITAVPWLTFGKQAVDPVPSPQLGWMVGDVEIDPFNSNRVMYGTGATIFAASDLGNWDVAGGKITLKPMVAGLEETAVLDLISPPSGAPLLSALGDLGGFRHASLDAVPALMFTAPTLTSCRSIDYAELSPSFIVRSGDIDKSSNANVNRAGFSYDGGTSWFQASTEPGGVTGGGTIAAAADASRVVWAPGGSQVSWSTNNGSSWTASTGIPYGDAVVASDRVNPLKFYAFQAGTLYASTNGGAAFTAAGAGMTGVTTAKLEAVPGREGDVWVAGDTAGLFHSTSSGASFTKLANVANASAVGLGKAAPGATYPAVFIVGQPTGGVKGVHRSDDGGATWVRVNDDQHQWGLNSAAISGDPRIYGRVYVGTNGRGIFYGDVSGTPANDFSIAAAPTTLTVAPGASGTTTISIARTGTFTGAVTLTASGLPAGMTASFNPASATGTSSILTLTASSTAAPSTATVTITGTSGSLVHTATITLAVQAAVTPDFGLVANPSALTIAPGGSGTSTITVNRTGGFTGSVSFALPSLPAGVTATLSPTSTTGTSTTLTLAVASGAAAGTTNVTLVGTSGSLSRSVAIGLTIPAAPTPDFSLAASPATLSVAQGASGTSTIAITRIGSFTGAVAFTASGLPSGVTAAFSPATVTGTSSTLTLTASSTATAGTANVTVTGASGAVVHTAVIALTVTAGSTGGAVTATPVVASSGPYFSELDVKLANTATLTALTVTINVAVTTGVSYSGMYNTVGGQFTQSHTSSATAVTYTWQLSAGQSLGTGSGRLFAAQLGGTGTAHPTAGDTYTVTYTSGGVTGTVSGHF